MFRYKTICNEYMHTILFCDITNCMHVRSEAVLCGIPELNFALSYNRNTVPHTATAEGESVRTKTIRGIAELRFRTNARASHYLDALAAL